MAVQLTFDFEIAGPQFRAEKNLFMLAISDLKIIKVGPVPVQSKRKQILALFEVVRNRIQ